MLNGYEGEGFKQFDKLKGALDLMGCAKLDNIVLEDFKSRIVDIRRKTRFLVTLRGAAAVTQRQKSSEEVTLLREARAMKVTLPQEIKEMLDELAFGASVPHAHCDE